MGQACCAQKELLDNRSYFNAASQFKAVTLVEPLQFEPGTDPLVVERIRAVVHHQFKNAHLVERGEPRPLAKLEGVDCWYAGEWRGATLHGIGTLLLHDGSVYNGSFVNSIADGEGRYTYPNGSYYEGGIR